jgi:putative colanic acid biosynthesis UDP-glucose lipid carrier transferase
MERRNNKTNGLIKWCILAGDMVMLNGLLLVFRLTNPYMQNWTGERVEVLWVACNLAMVIAMLKYSTIIHQRLVSGGEILRRILSLTVIQTIVAYLIMKVIDVRQPVGWLLMEIGACQFGVMILIRYLGRTLVKRMRQMGRNTRQVTFVGCDPELEYLYVKLMDNPTLGYRFLGYYADKKGDCCKWGQHLGTLKELQRSMQRDEQIDLGDELYVCLPKTNREMLQTLSNYCDGHLIHFYYVPTSVEKLGIPLKRELLDDMEVYTTHKIPLENNVNKVAKRLFDVVISLIALACCIPILPVVALIILIQSPGPLFFRQKRTGAGDKEFVCYKFRSMHVNKEADTAQATKDDPRKFPFGEFMRKYNIDELPQFWNVLKGDMSVVGPRPHMLYHTEKYRQIIRKYMVRHFVKPGITGWAQVTGFRGETKELWQMEGRVNCDIWYIEHWDIWLDIRIVWMTFKTMFIHDKNAY